MGSAGDRRTRESGLFSVAIRSKNLSASKARGHAVVRVPKDNVLMLHSFMKSKVYGTKATFPFRADWALKMTLSCPSPDLCIPHRTCSREDLRKDLDNEIFPLSSFLTKRDDPGRPSWIT